MEMVGSGVGAAGWLVGREWSLMLGRGCSRLVGRLWSGMVDRKGSKLIVRGCSRLVGREYSGLVGRDVSRQINIYLHIYIMALIMIKAIKYTCR